MSRAERSLGRIRLLTGPAMVVVLLSWGASARAQTCRVPGSHPTVQAAVDDSACATITLSAQTYGESVNVPRSLTLAGPGAGGAVIQGRVRVVGAATEVTLQDLRIENGCPRSAVTAAAGARILGTDLEVERAASLPCPTSIVFADGFESSDTSAWSGSVP